MAPKEKKKKKKAKAPAYLTGEADLAPFGLQANQVVRNSLGMAATVLGVKADADGQPRVWVKYACGLEAPAEGSGSAGLRVAGPAAHVQRAVAQLRGEREALAAKWEVYNSEQARLKAAADKKKKKKSVPKPAPAAAEDAAAAQSAEEGAALAEGQPAAGEQGQEEPAPSS